MAYTIEMVERTTFLDARSNPVDGYRVTYRSDDGWVDWVEIPKATYGPASVKAAITAQIKNMTEVLKP